MALTERLAIVIDAHADKAITEFKKVGGAARGLQGSIAGGTKALDKFGLSGAGLGNMLKGGLVAGAAAAAGALVSFGVSAVKSVQELDAAILKFQRASGASTEEASALVAAFDDMAIPADTGSKAIFQLGKRLETSKVSLAGFGITAVKNSAGNTDLSATLLAVADAYVKTTDPAKRAALVTAAFGKSGADLIPILEKGSAGIKAFYADAAATGQIRTPEQVAQTEKLRVAMDGLTDAGKEFSLMAGTVLVPVLTDMANAATGAIGAIKSVSDGLGKIGDTKIAGTNLKGIADKINDVVIPGKLLVGTILDLTRKSGPAADGLGDIGEAAEKAAEDATATATAMDGLGKSIMGVVDADKALFGSHKNVAEAEADLKKLLQEGPVDKEEVADARKGVTDADRGLGSAQRDVGKAQGEYDEAAAAAKILGTGAANEKLADASDNLSGAQDNLAEAQARVAEAHEKLRKAQAGDPEFQKKVADARTKVAEATFRESEMALASIAAHDQAKTAVGGHAAELERLLADYRELIALHPEVALALAPKIAAAETALKNESSGNRSPVLANNPMGGGLLGGLAPSVTGGSGSTVNNNQTVTINATASEADARLIAKEVMWNLS